MDDDWITNFFEKSRIVSNVDMQTLWSRVLAGEANAPGAFSRKTVNLLGDLDKCDAELFTSLCGFCWVIGNAVPLVYQVTDEIYERHAIDFNSLCHLDALGLIQFSKVSGIFRTDLPQKYPVHYYGRSVELTLDHNRLGVGCVLFTLAGEQLVPVCGSEPVDGFFEFVYDRWALANFVPERGAEEGDQATEAERGRREP